MNLNIIKITPEMTKPLYPELREKNLGVDREKLNELALKFNHSHNDTEQKGY